MSEPVDRTSVPTSDMAEFVGPADAPDRFELLAERSGGAEGRLYQARFREPDAGVLLVAVKAMRVESTAVDIERWLANRAMLRTMHHPHVVRYLDHFVGAPPHALGGASTVGEVTDGSILYEVMEWIDGTSLQQLVRAGQTSLAERWQFVEQLAAAVDYLHDSGTPGTNAVLHRDIKPSNVVVNPSRGAVLVDFGLARVAQAQTMHRAAGTEGYRAPELLHQGQQPSPQSDRWSTAATAHFAFTGQPPSMTTPTLIAEAMTADAGNVDSVVEAFRIGLDPKPARRPTRMADWAAEVRHALTSSADTQIEPGARRRSRRGMIATIVAIAALALVGGAFAAVKLASNGRADNAIARATTSVLPSESTSSSGSGTSTSDTSVPPATTFSATAIPATAIPPTTILRTTILRTTSPPTSLPSSSAPPQPGDCATDPKKPRLRNSNGKLHAVQRCDVLLSAADVHVGSASDTPVIGHLDQIAGVYFFCKVLGGDVTITLPSGAPVRTNLWARTQLSPQAAGASVPVDGWVSATLFKSPIDSLRYCSTAEKPTS